MAQHVVEDAQANAGDASKDGGIAFLGDTQETLLVERLMGREDNRAGRARIVQAVADARPATVVHLGDLVALSTARAWARFDACMRPLADARVPVVAIRGNHDVWGARRVVEREWRARFDAARWRIVRAETTALVLLDSNRRHLGERAWGEQRAWLDTALRALDAGDDVTRVLVCVHHPPLTNSASVDDAHDVARDLLPSFLTARKTRALLSGHVHAYERFAVDGAHGTKHLVVAGGAGGPRVRLRTGPRARHVDACALPSPRPLHWVSLREGVLEARDVEGRVFDRVDL